MVNRANGEKSGWTKARPSASLSEVGLQIPKDLVLTFKICAFHKPFLFWSTRPKTFQSTITKITSYLRRAVRITRRLAK